MPPLVRTSRHINRYLGDTTGRMLCTRIYVNAKGKRNAWRLAQHVVDIVFILVRLQRYHTRKAALWELRYDPPANKKTATSPQKTARPQQASPPASQTPTTKGTML